MRTPDGVPILKHLLAFHMVVILAHKPFSLLTYSKSLSIWAYCMLLRSSQSSWALRAEKQGSKKKPFPTGSAEIKLRALHMQGKDSNTTTSTSLAKKMCIYVLWVCVCVYIGVYIHIVCVYICIYVIYLSCLKAVGWVVQPWLPPAGKAKNLAVVHSIRLNVSAVQIWCWTLGGFLDTFWSSVHYRNPEEVGSNTSEAMPQK